MKKVLVPLEIYQDNPIVPVIGVRPTYIEKLTQYGLLPLFIFPTMTEEMIDSLYKESDGIYLTGGDDLDPKLYNQKKHSKTILTDSKWDEVEVEILKRALKDKKPMLLICRGSQVLNVAAGGTLIQHLPDIIKKENHNTNQNYDDLPKVKKNKVFIDKKSQVYKIIKSTEIGVNCYHHQAVEELGENMIVTGKTKEGVIEIIEHNNPDYFCIGIQSHPEVDSKGPLEKIFQQFANVINS